MLDIATRPASVKGFPAYRPLLDFEALGHLAFITIHVPMSPLSDATTTLRADPRWFTLNSGLDPSDYFALACECNAYEGNPSRGEFWLRRLIDLPPHVLNALYLDYHSDIEVVA